MRILFTVPRILKNVRHLAQYAPLGPMLLSSALKRNGHETAFIDGIVDDLDGASFAEKAAEFRPDAIGLSLNALQMSSARDYARQIRDRFGDIIIMAGGPLLSADPVGVMEAIPEIDFAVCGEGEYAVPELLRCLEGQAGIEDVPNLVFRVNGTIRSNGRQRITDLSSLPFPDYALVENYLSRYGGAFPVLERPSMHVICSRGCPFKCKFCSSNSIWASRVVFRDIPSIIEECSFLVSRYGAREIFLVDDMLNVNREWFFSLCDSFMESGLSSCVLFRGAFRAGGKLVDREILEKAKQAGFWAIMYGAESGSQAMLDKMNKKLKVEEIAQAFELTRRAGIKTVASFIIGCPGETHCTIRETFDLIKRIEPDFGGMAVVYPFPGSELYAEMKETGLADNLDLSVYDCFRCRVRTENLTSRELAEYAKEGSNILKEISIRKNRELFDKNCSYFPGLANSIG